MIYQFVDYYLFYWIFLVNLIVFYLVNYYFVMMMIFFFIGDPSLPFFDVGLDDFDLLDAFLADVMIG